MALPTTYRVHLARPDGGRGACVIVQAYTAASARARVLRERPEAQIHSVSKQRA